MQKHYFIFKLMLILILNSCEGNLKQNTSESQKEPQMEHIASTDDVDSNFELFIEKFSSDTNFQMSRTLFPLKIMWYDIDQNKDTCNYTNRSDFEMIVFRTGSSRSKFDEWEQKIVLDSSYTTASVEIRGIENGIATNYLFEKIKSAWTLVAIDDKST
jgi:hypothetical protein